MKNKIKWKKKKRQRRNQNTLKNLFSTKIQIDQTLHKSPAAAAAAVNCRTFLETIQICWILIKESKTLRKYCIQFQWARQHWLLNTYSPRVQPKNVAFQILHPFRSFTSQTRFQKCGGRQKRLFGKIDWLIDNINEKNVQHTH